MNRSRVPYILVPIGAALIMTSLTLVFTGTSYFVRPVTADLGITRSAFMVHFSLLTLMSLVTMPVVGRLAQRFSVRLLVAIGGVWMGVGLMAMSLANSLPMIYLCGFWIGLSLFPTTMLLAAVLINAWYVERRGTMLGLASGTSGIGGVVVSAILPTYIADHGWRSGYFLLGIMVLVPMLLASILVRNKPEDLGLEPYGATSELGNVGERAGMPYRLALKSKPFWMLYAGILLAFTAAAGQEHYPAHLAGQGIGSNAISTIMSIFFLLAIAVVPVVGFMIDKIHLARTLAVVWALGTMGWALMSVAGGSFVGETAGIFLVLIVTANGVFPALMARIAFGDRDYAGLAGILIPASTIGIAIGAPLWGLAHDLTHSYVAAFVLSPITMGTGFILSVIAVRNARAKWATEGHDSTILPPADKEPAI